MSEIKAFKNLAIIGAGAWGTALAATAARAGCSVQLWAHETKVADTINNTGENATYLPGITLDKNIAATGDMAKATKNADAIFLVCPAQHVRTIGAQLASCCTSNLPVVLCAKGIEQKTGTRLTDILRDIFPNAPLAVLSGPTFAAEVARNVPSAITLACCDTTIGNRLVHTIGTPTFRPYLSDDVTGAEIGGAVKNVMAIACGIVEGKKLGDNARAALVTRGLAEISRLAVALGAQKQTLMGLSGMGDLILTANSMQSRNFSLGVALGQGKSLGDILESRQSVAEGVYTAKAVVTMANELQIDMPICTAVKSLVHNKADLNNTINGLLNRPFKSETE